MSRKSQAVQRLSCEPVFCPLIHRYSTELLVELDGWMVPIQYPPLQPGAATFSCDPCQVLQQGQPDSLAAQVRHYVQVFQVEPWLPQKRGIGREEDSKARAFPIPMRQQHLGRGLVAE